MADNSSRVTQDSRIDEIKRKVQETLAMRQNF